MARRPREERGVLIGRAPQENGGRFPPPRAALRSEAWPCHRVHPGGHYAARAPSDGHHFSIGGTRRGRHGTWARGLAATPQCSKKKKKVTMVRGGAPPPNQPHAVAWMGWRPCQHSGGGVGGHAALAARAARASRAPRGPPAADAPDLKGAALTASPAHLTAAGRRADDDQTPPPGHSSPPSFPVPLADTDLPRPCLLVRAAGPSTAVRVNCRLGPWTRLSLRLPPGIVVAGACVARRRGVAVPLGAAPRACLPPPPPGLDVAVEP